MSSDCRFRGFPAPFGGPASGLWPSGSGSAPPSMPPPPLPCLNADILTDLFAACSGVISSGSPGPICGWTYFVSFGVSSTITFSPGSMRFDCPTSNETPAASKPISMSGVNNRTVEFTFHEFDDLSPSTIYVVNILDAANVNVISIELGGNGAVDVGVGPQSNVPFYEGFWTPNKGRHVVHVTVDNAGIPRVWIDGQEIHMALVTFGPLSGYPADSVVALFADLTNDSVPRTAVLESLFIASGQIPPTRTFCRP